MSEDNIASFRIEEEETPCRQRPNQRRSTFFRRRSTLQVPGEDGLKNACDNENNGIQVEERIENVVPDDLEKKTDGTQFDIEKYIADLEEERKIWKQTLLDRKRQHKSISKQTSNLQRCEQDLDLNVLSESERTFLLVRPNYEHICEKAKKLRIMAAETRIFCNQMTHLHNQCMLRARRKLDALTTKIIDMVD
ncbi:uncharacterized protein LOC124407535 [Diprion similis]|uniref:uncharacterized protein LOC124407535 n=1 Tax=Diprion similis TaxID=362088 RepID=UPI001EF999A2|nr:uncharacterized protein LOC124407535 [Diprion similis]